MQKAKSKRVKAKRSAPSKDSVVALYKRWLSADENMRRIIEGSPHAEFGTRENDAFERRLARAFDRRYEIEKLMADARPKSVEGLRAQLDVARMRLKEPGTEADVYERLALNAMCAASNAFGLLLDLGGRLDAPIADARHPT